jgi:hypothetical protein
LVAAAACAVAGFCLFDCTTTPPPLGGAGGSSGEGGSSTVGNGDAATANTGGSSGPDAELVSVKLDVIPAWWIEQDAWGPDLPAAPNFDVNCGITEKETTRQPVDVLLLLDRSGSMQYKIDDDCYCSNDVAVPSAGSLCDDTTDCTTRWDAVVAGLKKTFESASFVNWGLKLFPSATVASGGNQCSVNQEMEVAVAADSAPPIQSEIDSMGNDSFASATPTALGVQSATSYLQGLDDPNKKFILLATDGAPNCKGGNVANADLDGASSACAAALAAGIPVYVIGIGPSVDNLSALAQAGGTNDYHPANSPDQLAEALTAISKIVVSCVYQTDSEPEDPENVAVYVNKQLIEKDAADGWKYGTSTKEVVLTGSYCQDITDGKDTTVQILFGCPGMPPFDPFLP